MPTRVAEPPLPTSTLSRRRLSAVGCEKKLYKDAQSWGRSALWIESTVSFGCFWETSAKRELAPLSEFTVRDLNDRPIALSSRATCAAEGVRPPTSTEVKDDVITDACSSSPPPRDGHFPTWARSSWKTHRNLIPGTSAHRLRSIVISQTSSSVSNGTMLNSFARLVSPIAAPVLTMPDQGWSGCSPTLILIGGRSDTFWTLFMGRSFFFVLSISLTPISIANFVAESKGALSLLAICVSTFIAFPAKSQSRSTSFFQFEILVRVWKSAQEFPIETLQIQLPPVAPDVNPRDGLGFLHHLHVLNTKTLLPLEGIGGPLENLSLKIKYLPTTILKYLPSFCPNLKTLQLSACVIQMLTEPAFKRVFAQQSATKNLESLSVTFRAC